VIFKEGGKMKVKMIPTVLVLLFFSWMFAILGLTIGPYLIIFRSDNYFIKGWLFLFGGLFLFIIIRTVANIAQILFDSKLYLQKLSLDIPNTLNKGFDSLNKKIDEFSSDIQEIKTSFLDINQNLRSFQELAQTIHATLQETKATIQKTKDAIDDFNNCNE
jgi:uncharacterized protein YoxC